MLKCIQRDFPGDSVIKTLCFHGREILHAPRHSQKKKKKGRMLTGTKQAS